MRILVIVTENPPRRFLVKLHTEELIAEIRGLIDRKKHFKAIGAVLAKGRLEREVSHHEVDLDTNLILSEKGARWDLK